MNEERWFRVILEGGEHFLLEGTKFYYEPSGDLLKVLWEAEEVAFFPLHRVVVVMDEQQYQAGIEKRDGCDTAECES